MSEIFFTSDTHFGHKNIIEFEPIHRPFGSLDQMHHEMIKRWNMVVGKNDLVYHLGDVAFNKKYLSLLNEMNGRKRLIMGNHDSYETSDYLKYFEKCYGVKYWEGCVLTHIPVHHNNLTARHIVNVHGHLHSKRVQLKRYDGITIDGMATYTVGREDKNYFNVSVEQNDLMPFHADKIRERVEDIRS